MVEPVSTNRMKWQSLSAQGITNLIVEKLQENISFDHLHKID